MKIRCVVVDDEPMALEKLQNYISKIPYLELVGACECASEAMAVLSENEVDAMFIDINMPDVNGLEFVRGLVSPPMVVFTTAYPEYAVESYKVSAVDYLLKPFSFEDFQRAAGKLSEEISGRNPDRGVMQTDDALFLKVDYRYVRVSMEDIVYVEGMNEYLKVHLTSGDPLLTHTTFRNFNQYLPAHFLQVHRSYVVNMHQVKEIERSVILMSDGTHISISDSNKDAFMQYLQRHTIRK